MMSRSSGPTGRNRTSGVTAGKWLLSLFHASKHSRAGNGFRRSGRLRQRTGGTASVRTFGIDHPTRDDIFGRALDHGHAHDDFQFPEPESARTAQHQGAGLLRR